MPCMMNNGEIYSRVFDHCVSCVDIGLKLYTCHWCLNVITVKVLLRYLIQKAMNQN